jgi:hypothetical protein
MVSKKLSRKENKKDIELINNINKLFLQHYIDNINVLNYFTFLFSPFFSYFCPKFGFTPIKLDQVDHFLTLIIIALTHFLRFNHHPLPLTALQLFLKFLPKVLPLVLIPTLQLLPV